MFRTKKDVDKHVQDINSKIKSTSERNLKGYSIAKLYYGVGDYENSRRYLATYLVERDSSSVAHKLYGQIYEQLKQPDKALECYKKSYELESSADLVTKICSLMTQLPIEPGRAKYWVEVGEKMIPHSEVVYKLREAMLTASDGENSPELEQVLLAEIQARPEDVQLVIRLVTMYQRTARIKDGYTLVMSTEGDSPWPTSVQWYRCLVEMCENYQVQYKSQCLAPDYITYLVGLDRLADLQTRDGSSVSVVADVLHRMDQGLYELGQLSGVDQSLLSHIKGQLYLGAAHLMVKRAIKDPHSWRESKKLAGYLYLSSYQEEIVTQYNELGGARKVVAGHVLLQMAGHDLEWGERIAGLSGLGDKLHRAVFVARDQRDKMSTSCLAGITPLKIARIPSVTDLSQYCPAYLQHHKTNLHHLIWLLLRYYSPGKVLDLTFPMPGASLKVVGREQVTGLDIDTFLYGVVYCVGWSEEGDVTDGPELLSPSLSPVVTSTAQEEWWRIACKAVDNTIQPQDRRVLQHGVDALRCCGLHGLDINLTMKLGKTFESLALECDGDKDDKLDDRAGVYYKASLVSVSQVERGLGLREPSLRLLPPAGPTSSQTELEKMKNAANFFLACQMMHKNNLTDALEAFKDLRNPYASFYSGEILKKQALEERVVGGLGDTGERVHELLVEAREAFYLTLDRLRSVGGGICHPLDAQLAEQIEEVENLIASTIGGVTNGVEEESALPTPFGTPSRRGLLATSSTPARSSLFDGTRVEARPSPERLDAQMRHLTSELSRTTSQLAKTLSHVENEEEDKKEREGERNELAKLVSQGVEVVDIENQVLIELKSLSPLLNNILVEVKEARKEAATYNEKILVALNKLCEAGVKQGVTDEERLMMNSLGYGGGGVAAVMSAQLLQQQLIQQHLALQTPSLMSAPGLSYPQQIYNPLTGVAQHNIQSVPSVAASMMNIPTTFQTTNAASMMNIPSTFQTTNLPPVNSNISNQPISNPPQFVHMNKTPLPATPQPTKPLPVSHTNITPITPQTSKPLPQPPTNVVISMSDPIPVTAPPQTSIMSVTVPPQHRLGSTPRHTTPVTPLSAYSTPDGGQHNYQIQMPVGASPLTQSPFDTVDKPAVTITTQSLLSNIPNPVFSAVTPSPEKTMTTNSSKLRMSSGTQETPKSRSTDTDQPDEYEPEVEFTPVIPLPEVVEVVTGEEEEEIVFEDRAKLFRFASETKEWKERGLGQAKILRNKKTHKVRFLMRREQTFKVCANHSLVPEMKIEAMKGNAKARIWGAQDFADEEVRSEKFCIRFKTPEQADNFEVKFKEAAESAKNAVSPVKEEKITPEVPKTTSLAQFAAAQKNSSWECSGCLTRNDNNKVQCLACETAKPGHEDEVAKMKEDIKPAAPVMTIGAGGGFKFGGGAFDVTTTSSSSTSSSFNFASPKSTSTGVVSSSSSGFSFGSTTTSSGFSFGTNVTSTSSVSVITSSKPSVGGFTFSTTPTVAVTPKTEPKVEEKSVEVAKPSPFSGFSFGAKAETVIDNGESKETDNAPLFGSKTEVSSFGAVAGEGFNVDPNFTGFAGAGSSLFTKKEEEGGADEEYEPDVQFTPVIPLPELVEVKTGEEEETALFSERSKLFRFIPETKEWKERGIGDFKILENNSNKKVRFLMRREQVLKVCCNHLLTKTMEFKPMSTSDRAWTWHAADFTEGEIKNELLALKFKTMEMATKWKTVVDECQSKITEESSSKESNATTLDKKTEEITVTIPTTLAQFAAAQKSSSWECSGCLTRNDNTKIQCLACETAKPGHEEVVAKSKEEVKPVVPVMTIGAGGGFKFGGGADNSSSSNFSFGTPTVTSSANKSGFVFGGGNETPASGGFSFNKESDVKPPFGTSEKHEFSFSGVGKSPVKGASPKASHNESTNSETDLYQEEEDNLYFEPVIPLPDKIDVVTGEEDEKVLYSHRAKLFRLTDGEWKERGLGDIKILQNESSGKARLLMRREQVLKICLNHSINPDVVGKMEIKDTKSWTWVAMDFSDGELESMTFALRFKTAEIAGDFKEELDKAVKDLGSNDKSNIVSVDVKKTSEKSKSKSPSTMSSSTDNKDLFPAEAFRPVEENIEEKELSFEGQGLKLNSAEDAADVAEKIKNHPAEEMHILTFSANTVGIEAAGVIGNALETRPEFRRAHWKDMFTGRMKTEIPPALVNLTRGIMTAQARLVELDLSDNAFGPVGMEGLVTFLKSPSCFSLRELKLNNTGCGVTGGKMLAGLLKECYNNSSAIGHPLALKVFILGRSRQENEGATALAEVFKMMGSLEEVVMPQNGIYHEGLSALADAFAHNPNLRVLNMNDNTFTATGARAMGEAIKKLNKLEYLNLGDCLLKTAGVKLICRALKGRHPNLRELVLDSNEVRVGGGLEIVEMVTDKDNLEKLCIGGNQFGDGLKQIVQKMKTIGKEDIMGEVDDNEEPDSDEEDPDLSDDEEEKNDTPKKVTESPKNIFTGTPKSSASIFGGSETKSLFGQQTTPSNSFKPAGNIFTNSPPANSSIFGAASTTTSTTSSFIFSKPADSPVVFSKPASDTSTFTFGKSASTPSFGSSVFSQPTTTSSTSGSIFGGSSVVTSGGVSSTQPDSTATTKSSSSGGIFGSSTKSDGFNFGSLASNSEGSGFNTAGEGFKFAGAGSSLFSGNKSRGGEDDEEDEEEDNHDPQFEPVVPLPELIEVKTGEEEEIVIFKHRAKAYRFCADSKQWKERGVGDIKLLRHPDTGVHRVLLRRDQVYKIAVNHRISVDMELKPMASSETAWCWHAMDFSEGHETDGSLEQLAVRFKHKSTADEFKEKFESCQTGIAQSPSKEVKREDVTPTAEETVGEDEDYEGYEDEDYEDNGETIMFHQTANLSIKNITTGDWMSQGEVDLRIMYDDDVYGARIIAEMSSDSSGEYNYCVCNHLIAMQTVLSEQPELSWSALDFSVDPPSYRTFKVNFSSEDITAEFRDMFAEGKDLADNSEILETVGDQDPANFYYGQGADGDD